MVNARTDFAAERWAMVERQLKQRGIDEQQILEAFRKVPRECFVGPEFAHLAYADSPLPIGSGQTISQPYIVGLMIQAAKIERNSKVLEVGTGSGYAAAVISHIAARVIGIERHHDLVELARERLARLGCDHVRIVEGDGTIGWPDDAPYDAILAAASGSHVPQSLVDQLATGGRIVMPIGDPARVQQLVKVTKGANGRLERSDLGAVRFVPLVGEEGWKGD